MLYDPARHEAPQAIDWDPDRAQGAIERIVRDTEAHLSERTWWPVHRRDVEPGDADVPSTTLYFGAAGVAWALDHLRAIGAARLSHDPLPHLDALLAANREWLGANGFGHESASYLMGDTPIEMMAYGDARRLTGELAPPAGRAAAGADRPVLPWRARLRGLPRGDARGRARSAADRRRRDDLGGRTAQEGLGPVSRHRRQRLCVLEAPSPHGRCALARASPRVRDARHRTDQRRGRASRAHAPFPLDRRSRPGDLP